MSSKCVVRLPYGDWGRTRQCQNDALAPSDKCGVHNDAAVARRQAEREERWRQECAVRNAKNAAIYETQRKLEAYDKLVMFALLVKVASPAWDKARNKLLAEIGESLEKRKAERKKNG